MNMIKLIYTKKFKMTDGEKTKCFSLKKVGNKQNNRNKIINIVISIIIITFRN